VVFLLLLIHTLALLSPLRLVTFSPAFDTWGSSDDSDSGSDSDGDNGTRRGPWSRKATKKYILSTLKDGGRAVRAIAVHVEEDQSLTHNAAGPSCAPYLGPYLVPI
jgi:hypothetical protein